MSTSGYAVVGYLNDDPAGWDFMVAPDGLLFPTIEAAKEAVAAIGGPGEDTTVVIVRVSEVEVLSENAEVFSGSRNALGR